jgi:hypothetical protein
MQQFTLEPPQGQTEMIKSNACPRPTTRLRGLFLSESGSIQNLLAANRATTLAARVLARVSTCTLVPASDEGCIIISTDRNKKLTGKPYEENV